MCLYVCCTTNTATSSPAGCWNQSSRPHPNGFSGRPGRPGSHLPRWKPFSDQEARKPGWITGSALPGLGLVNMHELVAWTSGAIQAAHLHGCAQSLMWIVIQASPVSHQLVRNVAHKWTLSVCSGHMFRSFKVLKGPSRSFKVLIYTCGIVHYCSLLPHFKIKFLIWKDVC